MASDKQPSTDDDQDELRQAMLAAFGDDAMDLFDDDDDDGFLPEAHDASADGTASNGLPASIPDWQFKELADDVSPLIRYMHDLNRTIYGADPNTNAPAPVVQRSSRCVVFSVADVQFGIPLSCVREIGRCPDVAELPCTPIWLRGIANLRGEILSVTDLRHLLQLPGEQPLVGEKIMVVHSSRFSATTALAVDRVHGIRNCEDLRDTKHLVMPVSSIAKATLAIEGTETILIDPDRLFGCHDMLAFAESG